MNYISGMTLLLCLMTCAACGAPASETESVPTTRDYKIHYQIDAVPNEGVVTVQMIVEQSRGNLRELSFSTAGSQLFDFDGDGELLTEGDTIRWLPERDGGRLRWQAKIANKRSSGAYDSWLNGSWGMFRAEDIIPRAQTRTLKGANSETSMSFGLPRGWSVVSEYSSLNSRIQVDNPARRFDQPNGWIAMGILGIRRETIAGTRIAVAAPEGENVRRMDMIALLNWVLPELNGILPDHLPRLTIVSAGDPMWRGGLSAPASLFIHADRPLISENATSTLVHELMHVAMGISADDGFDWIVEGLAEYYSLELLQRGGAITARRYKRALETQEKWAKKSDNLCGRQSTGANTARAVVVFRNLDVEIRRKSAGKLSLDDVVVELAARPTGITLSILVSTVTKLLQENPTTLNIDALPGCKKYMPTAEA
jgi:hypothetical protein